MRRTLVPLAVLLLVLTGCTAAPSTGTDAEPEVGTSTAEGSDPGAEDGTAPDGWTECPGIVERLNANEDDPTGYEQIPASEFEVPEVGAEVLAAACVIRVTIADDPITWAILPGDQTAADGVISSLLSASFVPAGSGIYGNATSGMGVLVQSFETGAGLDDYLVYSTAFESIDEPILYLGTFIVS